MTTPTPTPLRNDMNELLRALTPTTPFAVRKAINREILDLFDLALSAAKLPTSDTNGSEPEDVDQLVMELPNGLDPEGR